MIGFQRRICLGQEHLSGAPARREKLQLARSSLPQGTAVTDSDADRFGDGEIPFIGLSSVRGGGMTLNLYVVPALYLRFGALRNVRD